MKYPFTVSFYIENNHSFWIAESAALKGCAGQGSTAEEAIKELEQNENVWLKTAEEFSIPIPDVPVTVVQEHSGKFTVRVSSFVHGQAAEQAKKQGVSLNQYVNDALVNYNTLCATVSYVSPVMEECAKVLRAKFLETTASGGKIETKYRPRQVCNMQYSYA